jgi:hypothetical protein
VFSSQISWFLSVFSSDLFFSTMVWSIYLTINIFWKLMFQVLIMCIWLLTLFLAATYFGWHAQLTYKYINLRPKQWTMVWMNLITAFDMTKYKIIVYHSNHYWITFVYPIQKIYVSLGHLWFHFPNKCIGELSTWLASSSLIYSNVIMQCHNSIKLTSVRDREERGEDSQVMADSLTLSVWMLMYHFYVANKS